MSESQISYIFSSLVHTGQSQDMSWRIFNNRILPLSAPTFPFWVICIVPDAATLPGNIFSITVVKGASVLAIVMYHISYQEIPAFSVWIWWWCCYSDYFWWDGLFNCQDKWCKGNWLILSPFLAPGIHIFLTSLTLPSEWSSSLFFLHNVLFWLSSPHHT